MNTSRDDLPKMLHEWRVKPPADPGFRHAVWQRIQRPPDVSWAAYLRTHLAAWTVAAVLTLGVAGLAGRALAQVHIQADREAIVTTYLVELDPRVQAVLRQ